MKGIVLLIVFILLLSVYLYVANKRKQQKTSQSEPKDSKITTTTKKRTTNDEECCGQHEVCERDTLINTRIQAEYYDDEELDQFKGRDPESYTEGEIKLFEDIFYTLKEHDISGWLKSLQIREVQPPSNIKEEALFIVQERRFNK